MALFRDGCKGPLWVKGSKWTSKTE